MNLKKEDAGKVQSLIDQLQQTVAKVSTDDLVLLAKMHGWCQALVESCGTDPAGSGLREQATTVSGNLETLILGEAADPEGKLRAITAAVAGLGRTGEGTSQSPDAADFARSTSDPTTESEPFQGTAPSPVQPSVKAGGPVGDAVLDTAIPEFEPLPEAQTKAPEPPERPPYVSRPVRIAKSEEDFVRGFIEEAGEHVDAIEAAVLEVEQAPEDVGRIDALFRPFHTVKGAAGFLNLHDIGSLTHEAETLLDQARKGNRAITPGLIDLIFDVVDVLKAQLAAIRTYLANPTGEDIILPPVENLIAGLRDVIAGRVQPLGHQPVGASPNARIGDTLVEQGVIAREAVEFAANRQSQAPGQRIGETLIDMGMATPRQVSKALRSQGQPSAGNTPPVAGDQSVRIDTAKLDALVDMVGELVIAQTLVSANPQVTADPKLAKDVTQATKIVRDVQDLAMAMRMIPIGPTFQKMARLVRDVSRKVNKNVQLTISGEDTELDKNVIQQINDPLVHMVRNAVDHGIEPPEARRAAGKPEAGSVHLAASHEGGNIVIEIRDDGKGLDPKALIAKGVEKGLVQPGENLTDEQAFQLVFAPGFSTAVQVTGISGRGVGMDVVRRNIEQLRGKCEITSKLGSGSCFAIRLPLTLAIIDGMILRVGQERFIIQTIMVEQALRPKPDQITTVQHRGAVLKVRGRLIPLVQLGQLFHMSGWVDPCNAMVVIAQYAGGEIGLVVEELLGQQQVVIKSLGEQFAGLQGISGAAILGDGRVGLILEITSLAASHQASTSSYRQESARTVERASVQPDRTGRDLSLVTA